MQRHPFWHVWTAPLLMGLMIVFGLSAALLGTGLWHWLSWLTLFIPLAVLGRYVFFQSLSLSSKQRD